MTAYGAQLSVTTLRGGMSNVSSSSVTGVMLEMMRYIPKVTFGLTPLRAGWRYETVDMRPE